MPVSVFVSALALADLPLALLAMLIVHLIVEATAGADGAALPVVFGFSCYRQPLRHLGRDTRTLPPTRRTYLALFWVDLAGAEAPPAHPLPCAQSCSGKI